MTAIMGRNKQEAEDHDLIVTLVAEVRQIRTDIKELKDGTTDKIKSLESEVEKLKLKTSKYSLTLSLYTIFIGGLVGLLLWHIFKA